MGESKSLFAKLKKGLFKTRKGFGEQLSQLISQSDAVDDDFYEELLDILILADIGVASSEKIIDDLKIKTEEQKIKNPNTVTDILKEILIEKMDTPRPPLKWPMVMMLVGVNGVGKTTAAGKLALRFQSLGRTITLVAADTFRAAATEQLEIWAKRAKVPIVKHSQGSDPAAVVYDGIKSALARKTDLLIVDTAGRLHNKNNLMSELQKMHNIINKEYSEAELRRILVIDATTGQNGLAQAKIFKELVNIDGIILTKLDGTAKGGIAIAIKDELKLPVWYVGVGEGIEDLQPFEAKAFVEALF